MVDIPILARSRGSDSVAYKERDMKTYYTESEIEAAVVNDEFDDIIDEIENSIQSAKVDMATLKQSLDRAEVVKQGLLKA